MALLERAVGGLCRVARVPVITVTVLLLAVIALRLPEMVIDPYSVFDPDALNGLEPEGAALRSTFPAFDLLTVSIPTDGRSPYDPAVLERVRMLSTHLSALPEVSGLQSVSTTTIVESVDGVLIERPLLPDGYAEGAGDRAGAALQRELATDPLLRQLLLAPDGAAWNLLVVPESDGDLFAAARAVFQAVEARAPEAILGGYPHYLDRFVAYVTADARRIGLAIALVILAMELLLLRHIGRALVVWLTAAGAAVGMLGAYAAAGIPFGVEKLLIVALVVIVSTSYGIHVVRYQDAGGLTPCRAAAGVAPIVVVAATTTMLGFATLFSSAVPQLVDAALFALIGIAVATVGALLPGAAALSLVHPRAMPLSPAGGRGGDAPVARRRRRGVAAIAAVVVGVAAVGIPRVLITPAGPQDLFTPRSGAHRSIRRVQDHYGSTSELLLYLDSGAEYGLLDPALFAAVARFADEMSGRGYTGGVIAYTDVVRWFWDRYETPQSARGTPESIGEALELLAGREDVLGLASFVDPAYRTARIVVRIDDFAMPDTIIDVADEATARLVAAGAAAGRELQVVAGGISYSWTTQLVAIIRSLSRGVLVFFPVLLLLLTVVMRRVTTASVLAVPSVVGVSVYLGMFGWIGIPFTTVSAIGLAIVLGVSVDDAVYLGLFRRHAADAPLAPAIRAVVETTAVIVAGLLALLLSRVGPVPPMVVATAVALCCATATVVLLVPYLLHLVEP